MLLGGFFGVDCQLLTQNISTQTFPLYCDIEQQYSRRFFTNNGRTAAVYALRGGLSLSKEDTILVPDYLCVSILNALETATTAFRFYRIKSDLTVDVDDFRQKLDEHVKAVYVIHYFGIPQPAEFAEELLAAKAQLGIQIIEDLTQAFYTRCKGRIGFGDYLVASTRKWMPVTDGGFLAIRDGVPFTELPLESAYDKAAYRQLFVSVCREYYEKHPEADIEKYLQLEKDANAARYLDFTPRQMTELSQRIMSLVDHSDSIKRRRKNYQLLFENLRTIEDVQCLVEGFDREEDFVPFGFPLLTENRDGLYQYLVQYRIIPEIQWTLPTQYYVPGSDAQYLSAHNLMLQCDQRYGEDSMNQIAARIKQYFRGDRPWINHK